MSRLLAEKAPIAKTSRLESSAEPSADWWALSILFLVYFVHSIDRSIINVLLEPIRREFGLRDSELGMLSGLAYALPAAITTIPVGMLVDRTARTRLLAALLATWSFFTALAGLSVGFVSLTITRIFVGAAEAGSPTTSLSLLSDYFVARLRPLAVSLFYLGGPVGIALGSYMAGAVTLSYGWRAALLVAATPGLLLSVVVFFFLREPKRGGHDAVAKPSEAGIPLAAVARFVMRHRGLQLLILGLVLSSTVAAGTASWITVLQVRAFGIRIDQAGLFTGLAFGICSGLGGLLGGVVSTRLGRGETQRLLVIMGVPALLSVPIAVVALQTPSHETFAGLMLIWPMLTTMCFGTGFSLCLSLAAPQIRGRLMAMIFLTANIIANGFGPQVVGWLSDWFSSWGDARSLNHAVLCIAMLNLVSGIIFLIGRSLVPAGVAQPLDLD
jgi:predicted MFS family arabinose efflux permease